MASVAPTPDSTDSTLRPTQLALAAIALIGALLLAIPGIEATSRIWSRSEFFGHGYMIPVVALFLLYQNRYELQDALPLAAPPLFGFLMPLGVGLFMVLSLIGDVVFAAGISVPLLLLATVYAVGGRPLLGPTLVPLGFLLLMVPPPAFLITRALVDLKLFVTDLSVRLLQTSGFTIASNGNEILVPGHRLFVADACSGLTSIVTLIPLACIVAYFLSHGTWRRTVVIGSVVPLAMLANILRVTVTVAMVESQGIEFAQGMLHESFGVTTYIVGTLALIGVAKALR